LTEDPNNTVFGLVRDKAATIDKIAADPELKDRSNYHILEAELTSYDALKAAAAEVAKITGGAIDYLIANGGYVSLFDNFDGIGTLAENPKELQDDLQKSFDVNVVAQIHLITIFLPLILKGKTKKVISLTTAFADVDFTNAYDIHVAPLYSISKAAMNLAVAKFSAEYKKDGVLFLSITPGSVDVNRYHDTPPEQLQKLGPLMGKFTTYKPGWTGPVTPQVAVQQMQAVWEKATAEKDGGAFVSQFGDKQWL
jgi:NAD(P)-dependent dehydrogenase (short-subunit alcohol dehydrogenase family)